VLIERSVRAVGVVVLEVLVQHGREVARSGDQEVVEAFAAQCADEALGGRVGARRANWRTMRMSAPAKTASNVAVNLLSRSRISKPKLLGAVAEVHQQVAGLLGDLGPGGMGGDPGDVRAAAAVLDHHQDIEAT
jgi:hypothetical protein